MTSAFKAFLGISDHECYDVWKFQQKFGQLRHKKPVHLTQRKLTERAECLQEELNEFKAAILTQDLAEQADALVDLVYFAKGTANMLGLPWAELWDDVQRANLAKVAGVGKRGHQVDCIKPAGWRGPETFRILASAGYRPEKFEHAVLLPDGDVKVVVDEAKCKDDLIHLEALHARL